MTMNAPPRRTDRQMDGQWNRVQTDEHHGNSVTIRSNEGAARYKALSKAKDIELNETL